MVTSYSYDGANAVQEVIGGTNTANSLSGGIDEVFQRTDSAGARSFLSDTLGSTLALTDSTGTAQTSYTYEPFGNTTASGAATTNSFTYTGRELDAGNLYYYRARYYNPQLQRFISEDPIEFSSGDANLYVYTGESPVNLIDPSGNSNSAIHIAETYLAARDARLGIMQSVGLALDSALVDIWSQGTTANETNIHAMAGTVPNGYQTPERALEGTAYIVDNNGLNAYSIHAIEDSYSSSHDYQRDTSSWTWLWPSHVLGDAAYHPEARNEVAQYIRDRLTGHHRDPRCYLKPLWSDAVAGRKSGGCS